MPSTWAQVSRPSISTSDLPVNWHLLQTRSMLLQTIAGRCKLEGDGSEVVSELESVRFDVPY
jgi:hypothetical protein